MCDEVMKTAFMNARFRAEEPEGGWPVAFGVVTACNPMGVDFSDEENAELTRKLEESLREDGEVEAIFPVTGYDPDPEYNHAEAGFGVVCDESKILKLGKDWKQLAVFWVKDGKVWLLCCGEGEEPVYLRPLAEMLGEVSSR